MLQANDVARVDLFAVDLMIGQEHFCFELSLAQPSITVQSRFHPISNSRLGFVYMQKVLLLSRLLYVHQVEGVFDVDVAADL